MREWVLEQSLHCIAHLTELKHVDVDLHYLHHHLPDPGRLLLRRDLMRVLLNQCRAEGLAHMKLMFAYKKVI